MNRIDRIEAEAARWLLARDRLGAAWSSEQEASFQAWLAQDLAHRVAWLRLSDAWRQADRLGEFHALAASPRPLPRTHWRQRWHAAALAAMVALFVAGSAQLSTLWHEPAQFATAVGSRQFVSLEDGSRVTLNTSTRAHAEIGDRERRFWLEDGEAYFDIRHDARRPFVVFAGDQRITVLGTRFNVRRIGGQTQVLVESGRVRVEPRRDDAVRPPATVLEAGALAVLAGNAQTLQREGPEQVAQALQWRQGRLTFTDLRLADAAAEFNRYHRRQLVVDAAVADIRIGGSFEADNLDGFVRLAHEGFGLTVRTGDDRIYLGPVAANGQADPSTSPR